MNKLIFTSLVILFFSFSPAFAWTVAPVRFEIKGEKGKEYTFSFSVLNESQLHEKRFEIQTDDWVIDKENNFLRKAFNKNVENKYSSTNWLKITPQHFVVPPGQTKNIRFTVTIPGDLPADGEYSAGIFVGEKNIEKAPKGEKVVHIKQDTFIGVVVYVQVGKENTNIVLKDLKIDSKAAQGGLNQVVVLPSYENTGNIHSRAKLTLKMEKISNDSEASEKSKSEYEAGELVVLRESELIFPISVPIPLEPGSEWKFIVSADFGKKLPVLVGTKKYKVPKLEKALN